MPFLPPPSVDLNLTGFMLAAMAGFLSFLVFFGCALLCAQLGWITARQDDRGRVILMFAASGRRQGANTTVARILSNGKLTSAQVLALPEQEFKPEPSGEDICCAICLDEFQPQEKIRVLPCNHLFHQDCLVPWLTQRHSNCPLCKMDVLDHVLQHSTHKETVRDPTSSSFLRNLVRHWGGWTMVNTTQANTEQDEAGEIEMEVSISTANNAISPTS